MVLKPPFGSVLLGAYVVRTWVGLAVLLKPCRIVGAGVFPVISLVEVVVLVLSTQMFEEVVEVVVAVSWEVAHGVCWLRQVFLGFDNALLL